MLVAEQIAPSFFPRFTIYPCPSCVPFPMIKCEEITAEITEHMNAAGILGHSPDPKEIKNAVEHLMGHIIKERIEPEYPLPTSAAMKTNPQIPVFKAAGGGTLRDLSNQRKADIAMYKCNTCHALYVLPEDFTAAGRALDHPIGVGCMSPEGIQHLCLSAMQNAYQGLGMKKAEVYCFKNFMVLIDMSRIENPDQGDLHEMSLLTSLAKKKQGKTRRRLNIYLSLTLVH